MNIIKPTSVNILGEPFEIRYAKTKEIDIAEEFNPRLGEINHTHCFIEIYDKDRPFESIFQTIIHEIIHKLSFALNIECLKKEKNHKALDVLAVGISDTLIRNGWIKEETIGKETVS